MVRKLCKISIILLLLVSLVFYFENKEVDYINNYPYNYKGYNDYEFRNEHTAFRFKYPFNSIVREIKRRGGDDIREGDPELGGVEIYLNADSNRPILKIYENVSHFHGVFNRTFDKTGSLIIDNEKIADIWTDKENQEYINMCVTYRNTYEGASLLLEKDVFNKYKKEIFTILSSIRFYDDSI